MEYLSTYVEIYAETDGEKQLQSRVADKKALVDVLEHIQGKRFDILMICHACIVGTGTYDDTGTTLVIEHEDGTAIGFLERFLPI
jgi:hypothetical protein